MAQSKHQIEALLFPGKFPARHQFGQNFMIDQNRYVPWPTRGNRAPAIA